MLNVLRSRFLSKYFLTVVLFRLRTAKPRPRLCRPTWSRRLPFTSWSRHSMWFSAQVPVRRGDQRQSHAWRSAHFVSALEGQHDEHCLATMRADQGWSHCHLRIVGGSRNLTCQSHQLNWENQAGYGCGCSRLRRAIEFASRVLATNPVRRPVSNAARMKGGICTA